MNGNADVVAQLDVALEDEQDVHEGGEEESDPDKTSRLRHASSTCPSLHPDVGTHRYMKRDPEFLLYVYCVVLFRKFVSLKVVCAKRMTIVSSSYL